MSKIQKSRSLIYPLFNFPPKLNTLDISTYMGHAGYEGESIWGNYFYVEVNALDLQNNPKVLEQLRQHDRYVDEIHGEISICFVFSFTGTEKLTIVIPFLQGKYSEICREYVNKYFHRYNKQNELSSNWRILNKHLSLRHYWERAVGTKIPPDSEVWPKPRMKDEIFGQQSLDSDDLKDLELTYQFSDIELELT